MVSLSSPTLTGDETSVEASAAIEEMVCEFGVRAVLSAVLASSLADPLQRVGGGEAALRVSQVILREVAFSDDPRLQAEIMAIGAGVILDDDTTMTRIAAKHGLTKSAISKRVVNFVEENGLPPSVYMRKEADRKTYALTNRARRT